MEPTRFGRIGVLLMLVCLSLALKDALVDADGSNRGSNENWSVILEADSSDEEVAVNEQVPEIEQANESQREPTEKVIRDLNQEVLQPESETQELATGLGQGYLQEGSELAPVTAVNGHYLCSCKYVQRMGLHPSDISSQVLLQLDGSCGETCGRDTCPRADDGENMVTLLLSESKELLNTKVLPEKVSIEEEQTTKQPRARPMGLDEYKKAILQQQESAGPQEPMISTSPPPPRKPEGGVRYNYAAASLGAKVVAANKDSKGAHSVLDEDKDKYLRNPCSVEDKFFVVELVQDTRIDTVVLSNYEYYSSGVKDFELLGSQEYPTTEWTNLGRFTAMNIRHPQSFNISEPLDQVWVRYLLVRQLSHWGSEFYCTLSLLRVHGTDPLESLRKDLEAMASGTKEEDTLGDLDSDLKEEVLGSKFEAHKAGVEGASNSSKPLEDQKPEEESVDNAPKPDEASKQERIETRVDDPKEESKKESRTGDAITSESSETPKATQLKGSRPESSETSKASQPKGSRATGDFVFRSLYNKIKSLEVNVTLFERYLNELNAKYVESLSEVDEDITKLQEKLKGFQRALLERLAELSAQSALEAAALRSEMRLEVSSLSRDLHNARLLTAQLERRQGLATLLAALCLSLSLLLVGGQYCLARGFRRLSSGNWSPGKGSEDPVVKKRRRHRTCINVAVYGLGGTMLVCLVLFFSQPPLPVASRL